MRNKGTNFDKFREKERQARVTEVKRRMFKQPSAPSVNIKVENDNCMPVCKTTGSVGYDLIVKAAMVIPARSASIIPTGVFLELPNGLEAQVRPRSSTLLKHQLLVQFGTIDMDYRGEVGVIVFNLNDRDCSLAAGDRIAQLCFARITKPFFNVVDQLSNTERGSGGFGSTGK